MPSVQNDTILKQAIQKVAAGQELSSSMKTYLDLKYNQLQHEDELFSTLALKDNTQRITRVAKVLPDKYDFEQLDAIAYKLGQENTTNNPFEISNKFFDKNLRKKYKKLKGKQSKYSYVRSPEFADFQLVLNQFAKNNTDVIFVIPPVNKHWSDYTGLSQEMLQDFNQKITYQLRQQGFNNIVDLSKDDGERYFMQDTIHLGWRGWLKMDQAVAPFLTKDQPKPKYQIDNYFYSKSWQQLDGKDLDQVTK